MNDREKIIKGLECCLANAHNNCPYKSTDEGIDKVTSCTTYLMKDALALLKAQEPRVMTLEDLSEICVEFKNDLIPMSLTHFNLGKIICYMQDGSCRLWSAKPSIEQREEAKWDDA